MARPRVHLLASLGIAAAQYASTRRLLPALAPLLSGFLIDADHLVDHWLYNRFPKGAADRLVLPLHGWEYVAFLALAEPKLLRGATARGLLLGYLAHLLIDQATNNVAGPQTYSLLARARLGFHGSLFRESPVPSGNVSGNVSSEAHAWRETPVLQIWRWL